ncbi:Farnesoate epoxidase [Orchesella cincta]|uniref:Farnesoate epoxidase n=1 Tax=Orchesella cincta TaxID=48709 RepID=A0A1D2MXS2_ORCCI|nr:Farnesoate epoxidase [Orchesella cincta]
MSLLLCVGLFVTAFIGTTWYIFQHYHRKHKNYPPGPIPWPLFGNVLQVDGKHIYISFMEWSKMYGKIMSVKLGFHRALVINDPKMAREMFGDLTFSGRPQAYFVTVLSGGCNGILVSEGSVWEAQRRFSLRHLRDFGFGKNIMQDLIMDNVQDIITWMRQEAGHPLPDLQRRLSLAVLNSLWTIISGQRYSQDDPHLKALLDSIQDGAVAITRHPFLIVAPWIRHILPTISGYTKFQKVVDKMIGFFRDTIEEHKHSMVDGEPRDFIDSYLKEMQKTKDTTSSFYKEAGERNLRAVVGDLFQGGSETTAITLTWSILFLMTHQDAQRKLQKEIDQVIGQSRSPVLKDRLRMPYTEAVILEISRMASVIPLGVFHSALVDTYFHDFYIPKGTWIWANQYAIHMDPYVWGDPENFHPERFLSKDGKSKRQCPGESLARDSLFLFITSIFQKFTAVPEPNTPIPDILDSDDGFFRGPKPFSVIMRERVLLSSPIIITVAD